MLGKNLYKLLFGALALTFVLTPVLLLLAPQQVASTTPLMQRLPTFTRFQCVLCHTTAAPAIGQSDLNAFGSDFDGNGQLWNETLALLNSDGDRCSNGFEMGDEDGDGVFDGAGTPLENSNPAAVDCTLPVDEATWGIIKDIFGNEFQELKGDLISAGDSEFSLYFP